MRINEIAQQTGLTRRAVKFYEEKGLLALQKFMEDHDADAACQAVDYQTVGQAIQDALPGFYGYYFMQHFQPYLQIKITTAEQQKAYETIVHFWDQTQLKIPFFLRISTYLMYRFLPHPSLEQMSARMDQILQMYLHPSEEEYAALCRKTRQNVRLKNSLLRYHPVFISQRRFMKRLKDCGYYDIFLPAMKKLSPAYREYQEALTKINERICQDLELYYDSKFHLIMKKAK